MCDCRPKSQAFTQFFSTCFLTIKTYKTWSLTPVERESIIFFGNGLNFDVPEVLCSDLQWPLIKCSMSQVVSVKWQCSFFGFGWYFNTAAILRRYINHKSSCLFLTRFDILFSWKINVHYIEFEVKKWNVDTHFFLLLLSLNIVGFF